EGRYICSSHDATIHQLAKMINEKWPEYQVPAKFEGIDDEIPTVSFSSKKLTGMGFKFKYDLEEMFGGAIQSCKERGLLPYSTNETKEGLNSPQVAKPDTGEEEKLQIIHKVGNPHLLAPLAKGVVGE
nr:dihydroflavonol 4-reductase [Tanacetum cinerariifolium]